MTDLFDYTAERLAYEGGRSLSQERAELLHPEPQAIEDGLFSPAYEAQSCGMCGATFYAKPRAPALCNLCRNGHTFCPTCGLHTPNHSKACPKGKV